MEKPESNTLVHREQRTSMDVVTLQRKNNKKTTQTQRELLKCNGTSKTTNTEIYNGTNYDNTIEVITAYGETENGMQNGHRY